MKIFGSTAISSKPILFWNTLSGKKETFKPIKKGVVGMYNCGPTVYNYVHIGNLRSYIFADTIRRVLEWNGYVVKQIINITDVGHLTSDADEGADKLEVGAKRENKSVKDIVEHYTEAFFDDLKAVNIPIKKIIFPRATDNIKEQISLVKTLLEKGHAYKISDGIYFDTSTFPEYGKLGKINTSTEDVEARIKINKEKKHQADFAIWKFSGSENKREQEWPSPWGVGFPGWHIECSAMSMKYLGETFDIHTSGIDHIPVHHNNEIAQSESATSKPLANFWLHNAFISLISGEKMSKSEGNFIRLKTLSEKNINPLVFRYWLLTAHYRSPIQFSYEALGSAKIAYEKLVKSFALLSHKKSKTNNKNREKFTEIINNDLNTPETISFIWQILKDRNMPSEQIRATIAEIDSVLGLGIVDQADALTEKIMNMPSSVRELAHKRDLARKKNDWATADILRQEIEKAGFIEEDGPDGSHVLPK